MKTTRSTKRSFRPSVEALESREVPTVSAFTVASDPGILFVKGDSAANEVHIWQNDNANTLHVFDYVGTQDPVLRWSGASNAISQIRVAVGDGDDKVSYLTYGSNFKFAKVVDMDLGDGANKAFVGMTQYWSQPATPDTIEAAVSIRIRSLGSDGRVNYNQLPGSKVDNVVVNLGAIGLNASARVDINLGIDDDLATVNQRGILHDNARLDINLAGVNALTEILNRPTGSPRFRNLDGNDIFSVNLASYVPMYATVSVGMYGGQGNDTLSLTQRGELDGTMNINIRGGQGYDTLSAILALKDDSEGRLTLTMLGDSFTSLVHNSGDLKSYTGLLISELLPSTDLPTYL